MLTIVALIGGAILLLVLTIVWDKLLFARFRGDPVLGKLGATGAAWVTCTLLLAWGGRAAGASFARAALVAAIALLLPAVAVAVVGYRQAKALRARPGPEVASVFD